jgi:hypothetical protein
LLRSGIEMAAKLLCLDIRVHASLCH